MAVVSKKRANKRRKKRYIIVKNKKYLLKTNASDGEVYKELAKIIKFLVKKGRRRPTNGMNLTKKRTGTGKDGVITYSVTKDMTQEQLKRYKQLAEIQREERIEKAREEAENHHRAIDVAPQHQQPPVINYIYPPSTGEPQQILEQGEEQGAPNLISMEDIPLVTQRLQGTSSNDKKEFEGLVRLATQANKKDLSTLYRKHIKEKLPPNANKLVLLGALYNNVPGFKDHITPALDDDSRNFIQNNSLIRGFQKGDGLVDGKGGLYNSEVDEMMKDKYVNRGFLGVFPIDELGHMLEERIDKKWPAVSFILNTVQHNVKRGHFTAVWVDRARNNLEYYDPLGAAPPKEFTLEMAKVLPKLGLHFPIQYKINRVRFQAMNTSHCGYFSMKFLEQRYKSKPFKVASGFASFLGVRNSEKGIDKYKDHLVREFGYLFRANKNNKQGGGSIVDQFISSLPFELHLYGTNSVTGKVQKASFAGPGTRLDKRLNPDDDTPKEWSKPINDLDYGAYKHDLAYQDHKDAAHRNAADDALKREAERFERKPGISNLDKLDAKIVIKAMDFIHRKE